uniref:Oxysterol-binding protein n=1 Tax=Palpitomonas bilix TaxID=652834 RepID=A0A7S3GHS3_9EUKA|mmetsp:Transcript_501/g.1023  ORF Transcript_501/g.1023 Transcript_501/m.1023 type:complete len:368 (+) Transcript_501:31-1134(+)
MADENTHEESIWKGILSDLKGGADLTHIAVSARVLKPYSGLQKLEDILDCGEILPKLRQEEDPQERILLVGKLFIGSLHVEVFDMKKPFNPVLGEERHQVFKHKGDNGLTYYISEQVSHHPPVSVVHIRNDQLGISYTATHKVRFLFLGNSVEIQIHGKMTLRIDKFDEEYEIKQPTYAARGLLSIGKRGIERSGQLVVKCKKSQLALKFNFKPIGWLGMWGKFHYVEGHLKRVEEDGKKKKKEALKLVSGYWNEKLLIYEAKGNESSKKDRKKTVKNSEGTVYYDYNEDRALYKLQRLEIAQHERPSMDSYNVWGKAIDAIKERNYEVANREKKAVEQWQRKKREELKKMGQKHQQKYFEVSGLAI